MSSSRRLVSLVLLALVFIMDGYDINAMALAVPRLAPMGLDPADFGLVFSALLVGLGAGAALLAPLGDRLGRKPLIVFGCVTIAIATFATSLAGSIPEFIVWRLLTGAGLGACLPNCTALSAELAPERLRATLMAVVSAGIPIGAALAGFLAPAVVSAGGWQGLFIVPAIFAAGLAALLWIVLPADATRPARVAGASRVPQFELFRAPWSLPFAVFAGALTLNAMNLYLLTSWVPTVLPNAGFTIDEAARVTGAMQLTGLAIGIAMSVLIDRWRPGVTMVGGFLLMAACFLAIGITTPEPTRWTVLLLAGVGGVSGAGMALPALTAYLFPSRLLSSAVGMGVLVARLGAIAGPMLGSLMLAGGVAPGAFLGAAAIPAVIAAAICLGIPAALSVRKRERAAASAEAFA